MADFLCADFDQDDFNTDCGSAPSSGDNRIGGDGAIRKPPRRTA